MPARRASLSAAERVSLHCSASWSMRSSWSDVSRSETTNGLARCATGRYWLATAELQPGNQTKRRQRREYRRLAASNRSASHRRGEIVLTRYYKPRPVDPPRRNIHLPFGDVRSSGNVAVEIPRCPEAGLAFSALFQTHRTAPGRFHVRQPTSYPSSRLRRCKFAQALPSDFPSCARLGWSSSNFAA